MSLKLVTAPEVEPIIQADVEAQLQYELPVDQVSLVNGFISAIRQKAEVALRRALITQTWNLALDGFPGPSLCNPFAMIEVPLPPLQSVVSIGYLSTDNVLTVLNAGDYVVDLESTPGRITPAYGKTWPQTLNFPGSVRVQFVAGYGDEATDVPQCIKQWCLLNIAALYENRESESVVNGRGVVIDLSTMADSLLDAERWEVRVSFQSKTGTPVPDGYGGSAVPWVDFATNIAASIVPTTGRELLAAQAVQNESRFTITTRYVAGIIPAMRIVFGTRVFNILDTSNLDERNKELQFSCSEGLTQG